MKRIVVIFLLAMQLLSLPALADEDELVEGVIDAYTSGEPDILISDRIRIIAPDMKVYDRYKTQVSRISLRKGQKVKYKSYRRESDRRDVIKEIHIISDAK